MNEYETISYYHNETSPSIFEWEKNKSSLISRSTKNKVVNRHALIKLEERKGESLGKGECLGMRCTCRGSSQFFPTLERGELSSSDKLFEPHLYLAEGPATRSVEIKTEHSNIMAAHGQRLPKMCGNGFLQLPA